MKEFSLIDMLVSASLSDSADTHERGTETVDIANSESGELTAATGSQDHRAISPGSSYETPPVGGEFGLMGSSNTLNLGPQGTQPFTAVRPNPGLVARANQAEDGPQNFVSAVSQLFSSEMPSDRLDLRDASFQDLVFRGHKKFGPLHSPGRSIPGFEERTGGSEIPNPEGLLRSCELLNDILSNFKV
jgi:hypothetical protein